MYIYNALINAPSAHTVHINLNMIFYTHVSEHSPIKNNLLEVFYGNTHTYTAMNLNVYDADQYPAAYMCEHAHAHIHIYIIYIMQKRFLSEETNT